MADVVDSRPEIKLRLNIFPLYPKKLIACTWSHCVGWSYTQEFPTKIHSVCLNPRQRNGSGRRHIKYLGTWGRIPSLC
ncbi:hypothetical protein XENTR_v10020288 [Xenopus tropicalis]|nr:hypothetical protein XENTR_v10020288 [Xenopus tropicalis]